jgi:histidinol-phosphate/aromatic aminotransferase/cobyric acid decarboxylase-like protein
MVSAGNHDMIIKRLTDESCELSKASLRTYTPSECSVARGSGVDRCVLALVKMFCVSGKVVKEADKYVNHPLYISLAHGGPYEYTSTSNVQLNGPGIANWP